MTAVSASNNQFLIEDKTALIGESFTKIQIYHSADESTKLQVDLVNDVASHYGQLKQDSVLGRIDSWQNILSNKITALFRSEPKDVVDIVSIATNFKFSWEQIILEAKSKEVGVEPEIIFKILNSFPIDEINSIKWIITPNKKDIQDQIKLIANDIFHGSENSLYFNSN